MKSIIIIIIYDYYYTSVHPSGIWPAVPLPAWPPFAPSEGSVWHESPLGLPGLNKMWNTLWHSPYHTSAYEDIFFLNTLQFLLVREPCKRTCLAWEFAIGLKAGTLQDPHRQTHRSPGPPHGRCCLILNPPGLSRLNETAAWRNVMLNIFTFLWEVFFIEAAWSRLYSRSHWRRRRSAGSTSRGLAFSSVH